MKLHASFFKSDHRPMWVSAVLPFNIALGPVSTLVQLLILNLNGTVVEVGLAITLFNAVSIPAALFWGFVVDRFHRRKLLVMCSFLVTPLLLLLFLFASTTYWVSVLYALFSIAIMASTTPLNLLVMETEKKPKWASAFAAFSMMSSIGQTLGLLLGMIWSFCIPIEYLVIPLAVSSLVSTGLSAVLIKEPPMVFERQMMVMDKHSFFHRLHHLPYLFLKIPSAHDFKRIFRKMPRGLLRYTNLLYLAIFGFFLSSGIFNTALVPALKINGVSSLLVFSVMMGGMIVQIISFRYAGAYTEHKSPVKSAIVGMGLRAVALGLTGVFVYFLAGAWLVIPALVMYALAAGVAYAIYYTASNTMIFNSLSPRRNGSALGVYSALAGAATMLGSFASGFLSFYLGFHVTFIVSAAVLVVSALLLYLTENSKVSINLSTHELFNHHKNDDCQKQG
ncbi:MAG: MFS transporter [Candidatus Bathyarchaeota archaeon]|nr:MFS transporter [Candidatus Bathyarchaeota archaeon]